MQSYDPYPFVILKCLSNSDRHDIAIKICTRMSSLLGNTLVGDVYCIITGWVDRYRNGWKVYKVGKQVIKFMLNVKSSISHTISGIEILCVRLT